MIQNVILGHLALGVLRTARAIRASPRHVGTQMECVTVNQATKELIAKTDVQLVRLGTHALPSVRAHHLEAMGRVIT